MQHCQLVVERHDLEFQFRAAAEPASDPGEERRDDQRYTQARLPLNNQSYGASNGYLASAATVTAEVAAVVPVAD